MTEPPRIIRLGDVTSTMDEARALLAAGERAPFWVSAESQSGGRGRHGRVWSSPPGNLYATLALADPCEPARGAELGFVAGVALHRAVSQTLGLAHPALAIKWPNDLLLEGAKAAGLLLEGSVGAGGFTVLIGFGVNLVSAPPDTPYPARALIPPTGALEPAALLEALASTWCEEFARFRQGFAFTRQAWLARAAHLGQPAQVRLPGGAVTGVMRGINEAGSCCSTRRLACGRSTLATCSSAAERSAPSNKRRFSTFPIDSHA